jgi:hypothetical protein
MNNIIRAALLADTTDRTAGQALAANPSLFSQESDVPAYMYQSLRTLIGAGSDDTEFARRIIAKHGAGETVTVTSIEIQTISQDANNYSKMFQNDMTGSESARLQILFRTPSSATNQAAADTVKNLELRTRMILDWQVRQARGLSKNLTTTSDKSILNSFFWCGWERYLSTENELEIGAEYRVEYVRVFGP